MRVFLCVRARSCACVYVGGRLCTSLHERVLECVYERVYVGMRESVCACLWACVGMGVSEGECLATNTRIHVCMYRCVTVCACLRVTIPVTNKSGRASRVGSGTRREL